jgi:hypothetical protein
MVKWIWRLTGGRPMTAISTAFIDIVTGERVRIYQDRLGRRWLATGAWDLFRVSSGGDR